MDLVKLLDGHMIIKRTNSGNDWSMNKAGKFSNQQRVSVAWIRKNISESDYNELMKGNTIGFTVRRGRGFSYVEYSRVPIPNPKLKTKLL